MNLVRSWLQMTSSSRSLRQLLLAIGLFGLIVGSGCQAPQETSSKEDIDLTDFAEQQGARAGLLRLLESGGTIEIRTEDEDGSNFEDCALELWRDGERFALRLRKLGERFLWVGSNGQQWWVFELAADPVRLVVLPSGGDGQQALGSELLLFGPDQLLQLAGLQPVALETARPRWSDDGRQIRVEFPSTDGGTWARLVWYLDPDTLLPQRIEAIDAEGAVLLESTLSNYKPIRARDQPLGNWPQFPGKLRVRTPDDSIDVRLFFNRTGATGSKLRDALFDLDQLMKTFKPGMIEYVKK